MQILQPLRLLFAEKKKTTPPRLDFPRRKNLRQFKPYEIRFEKFHGAFFKRRRVHVRAIYFMIVSKRVFNGIIPYLGNKRPETGRPLCLLRNFHKYRVSYSGADGDPII